MSFCKYCNKHVQCFRRHQYSKHHVDKQQSLRSRVRALYEPLQWHILNYLHPCTSVYSFDRWLFSQNMCILDQSLRLHNVFHKKAEPCMACGLSRDISRLSFHTFIYQFEYFGVCMTCLCRLYSCTNWLSVPLRLFVDIYSNRVFVQSRVYSTPIRLQQKHCFLFNEHYVTFFKNVHMFQLRSGTQLPCTLDESWKEETSTSVETYIGIQYMKTLDAVKQWNMFI